MKAATRTDLAEFPHVQKIPSGVFGEFPRDEIRFSRAAGRFYAESHSSAAPKCGQAGVDALHILEKSAYKLLLLSLT